MRKFRPFLAKKHTGKECVVCKVNEGQEGLRKVGENYHGNKPITKA